MLGRMVLFSQNASLLFTVLTGTVPEFHRLSLLLMIVGSILRGKVGRNISKQIEKEMVEQVFNGVQVFIVLVNLYNLYQYIRM